MNKKTLCPGLPHIQCDNGYALLVVSFSIIKWFRRKQMFISLLKKKKNAFSQYGCVKSHAGF